MCLRRVRRGAVARAGRSDEVLDGGGAGQGIACIDVPYVVARGSVEPLVHRIIDPLITFAIDLGLGSQLADELQRVVLRSSVDDEVLDVRGRSVPRRCGACG